MIELSVAMVATKRSKPCFSENERLRLLRSCGLAKVVLNGTAWQRRFPVGADYLTVAVSA
jgi:hypothetical protein